MRENHDVELDVLAYLDAVGVLEQGPHGLGEVGCVLRGEGYVPRLVLAHGERESDDAVVEDVEARGLGIETYLGFGAQTLHYLAQLPDLRNQTVVVGRGCGRGEYGIRRGGRVALVRCVGRIGCGLRRGGSILGGSLEQVSLSGEGLAACRGRLGARHLRQLPLRRLTGCVGGLLGGGHVVYVAGEGREVELGEERLQLVHVRGAYLKLRGLERDGHVGAYRCQTLGQKQAVAPCGDLLALLSLDLGGILKYVFSGAPLCDELAGALLADAGHAGDVVRGVAPDGQNVAHEYRVRDSVAGAYGLRVEDLDAVALLSVDVAVGAHKLAVILVGRHHEDLIHGLGTAVCEGADDVVGLEALDLEYGYAHGREQTLEIGYREDYVLGRIETVGLVFGIYLFAERAPLGVECHTQQVGLLALEDVAQELRETEEDRGIHAVAVAHGAPHEGVVILEYQSVGVYEK